MQLFYCTDAENDCDSVLDGSVYGSRCHTARLVAPDGPSLTETPDLAEVYPKRRVTGWTPHVDYPSHDELCELGLEFDGDTADALFDGPGRESECLQGDKLYGWPFWIQAMDYPRDGQGWRMEAFFQVDSGDNVPYMFGDVGVGQLCRSPKDAAEMRFGWQCS